MGLFIGFRLNLSETNIVGHFCDKAWIFSSAKKSWKHTRYSGVHLYVQYLARLKFGSSFQRYRDRAVPRLRGPTHSKMHVCD